MSRRGRSIPPPPATVPVLPDDEAKLDLPLRDMLAKHRENPVCASCHARFDSLGLAFEGYGPIGERRSKDLAGPPGDTQAGFPAGTRAARLSSRPSCLPAPRQPHFIDHLRRKMLPYSLRR